MTPAAPPPPRTPVRRSRRPWLPGLLVLLALGIVSGALALTRREAGPPPLQPGAFMRGVALGLHSKEQSFDYGEMLAEIAATGADWVSLVFEWESDGLAANRVTYPNGRDWQWTILERTIRQAHHAGLHVMLFPIVTLPDARANEWRGRLAPADRAAWHRNYSALLTELAAQATRWQVQGLSVGSEFASLEGDREAWLETIRAVRGVFAGRLIYSANWDHYEPVRFWDAVDAIAISGYYELSRSTTPTLAQLTRSWSVVRDRILAWQREAGLGEKPLIFSELGYPSIDGCNIYPWNYTLDKTLDVEEQALCYRAFVAAWRDTAALQGVFFYNWWYNIYDPIQNGYSPRGKPAERVMRQWFKQLARQPATP